jgi:hypothetical protein
LIIKDFLTGAAYVAPLYQILERHMKIKVTGTRRPWIDGSPRPDGWEGEVDNALGEHLVANGLAEIKKGRPKKDDD